MDDIKIVRLKDGLDVICILEKTSGGNYILISPMMVDVQDTGKKLNLVMQHWLPTAIIKENRVSINPENILCFMEPEDNFREYFRVTVEKYNQMKNGVMNPDENSEEISDEELDEIMTALEEFKTGKDIRLH